MQEGIRLNSPLPEAIKKFPDGGYRDPLTSDSAGWRSLHLRIREWEPFADPVQVPEFGDPVVRLLLNKQFRIDHFSVGRWREVKYTRGTGELSPAGHVRRLRYDFNGQWPLAILALIVPQTTVDFVAQEVCKPKTKDRSVLKDTSFLDDPLIASFSFSVVAALRGGAPDFYAQAAAQWLAAHLLLGPSIASEWCQSLCNERISDARLIRVLEYINAHLSERLDLRTLSREAGISQFHFAALFGKAVGTSPHKHVMHLRMQSAKLMLRDTEKSVLEIALACGFGSASHFATAFRRGSLQSPTDYRSSQRYFSPDKGSRVRPQTL